MERTFKRNVEKEILKQDLAVLTSGIASRSGVFVWCIHNYNERKVNHIAITSAGKNEMFMESPAFETPSGYRLCARLYLGGYSLGKFMSNISVTIQILPGEGQRYESLKWPFAEKINFTIYDPRGESDHIFESLEPSHRNITFQKPRVDDMTGMVKLNLPAGIPLFECYSNFEWSHLKEDKLIIIVTVGDAKSPLIVTENMRSRTVEKGLTEGDKIGATKKIPAQPPKTSTSSKVRKKNNDSCTVI